jgi:hypothetical protein
MPPDVVLGRGDGLVRVECEGEGVVGGEVLVTLEDTLVEGWADSLDADETDGLVPAESLDSLHAATSRNSAESATMAPRRRSCVV